MIGDFKIRFDRADDPLIPASYWIWSGVPDSKCVRRTAHINSEVRSTPSSPVKTCPIITRVWTDFSTTICRNGCSRGTPLFYLRRRHLCSPLAPIQRQNPALVTPVFAPAITNMSPQWVARRRRRRRCRHIFRQYIRWYPQWDDPALHFVRRPRTFVRSRISECRDARRLTGQLRRVDIALRRHNVFTLRDAFITRHYDIVGRDRMAWPAPSCRDLLNRKCSSYTRIARSRLMGHWSWIDTLSSARHRWVRQSASKSSTATSRKVSSAHRSTEGSTRPRASGLQSHRPVGRRESRWRRTRLTNKLSCCDVLHGFFSFFFLNRVAAVFWSPHHYCTSSVRIINICGRIQLTRRDSEAFALTAVSCGKKRSLDQYSLECTHLINFDEDYCAPRPVAASVRWR